jgi:DNA-binding transcriptional LysR family regulator
MMHPLWNILASPRHIAVFEAAARTGSFTRAAGELNVQQPAVSATIKQLEQALGVPLFLRQHRAIELTNAGETLYAELTRSFESLERVCHQIRQTQRQDYVTLSASTAFNTYWMMPRLAEFQSRHPGVDLRLQSSDRDPDIDREGISLAIRHGSGSWQGCHAALIAPERICPVAAPRVMASAVTLRNLPGLLHQRLIHLEEPVRSRPDWRSWFAHFGLPGARPEGGLRFNDYALVLHAAMAGEGFAFGWRHLTDALVDQGLLAAKKDWSWDTGKGFYLVWSKSRDLSENALLVRDWMLRRAAVGRGRPAIGRGQERGAR